MGKLTPEQCNAVHKLTDNRTEVEDALKDTTRSVKKVSSEYEKKGIKFNMGGKEYHLKDVTNDVLKWIDKLHPLIKSVAEIQPLFVGLPYSVFTLISGLFTSFHQEVMCYLRGIDLVACTIVKLESYLHYLVQVESSKVSTESLEKGLASLTTHILGFFASYIQLTGKRGLSKVKHALVSKNDVAGFGIKCQELIGEVREAADACQRELSHHHYEATTQWRHELDARLTKIDSIHLGLQAIDDKVENIKQVIDAMLPTLEDLRMQELLGKLQISGGATYDSYIDEDFATCLDGTRQEILDQIKAWARDTNEERIFVLRGMAGTGKSTLARTIAKFFDDPDLPGTTRLGASFFFRRTGGEHETVHRLIPTIVRQLADKDATLASKIAGAISTNPDVSNKSLDRQFEILISPLLKLEQNGKAPQCSNLVILLDALDECFDFKGIQWLLEKIIDVRSIGSFQIRWLITSRETTTLEKWRSSVSSLVSGIKLEDSQKETITHDIRVFLCHRLQEIATSNSIPSWPDPETIDTLVLMASPLFIFASTLCRYVSGSGTHHGYFLGSGPRTRLKLFLERRSQLSGFVGTIDQLYEVILDDILPPEGDPEFSVAMDILKHILFPIIMMKRSLSLQPLSRFLGRSAKDIYDCLRPLSSVIQMPESLTGNALIRPLHASFTDFLLRYKNGCRYNIQEADVNAYLFQRCLHTLDVNLKQMNCEIVIENNSTYSDESQERHYLMGDMDYTLRNFLDHMEGLGGVAAAEYLRDDGIVHQFLQDHFHRWMEGLIWCDKTRYTRTLIRLYNALARVNSDTPGKSQQMLELVRDACWFGLLIQSVTLKPQHIHHYASYSLPRNSLLSQIFQENCTLSQACDVLPSPLEDWPLGHISDLLFELVPSLKRPYGEMCWPPGGAGAIAETSWLDSKIIATGSQSGQFRIYYGLSFREALCVQAFEEAITLLAFDYSGEYLAISSAKSLRIWNIKKGLWCGSHSWSIGMLTCVKFISGYSSHILLHTTAGSTKLIKSGSHEFRWDQNYQPEVEIRNLSNALHLCYERAIVDEKPRQSAVFGAQRVLSASRTGELERWHYRNGGSLGEAAQSMTPARLTFFSNGTKIVSEQYDGSVWIWSVPSRGRSSERLYQIMKHPQGRREVSISGMVLMIVSETNDELEVWDLDDNSIIGLIRRPVSSFAQVVLSPDGSTVAWALAYTLYTWNARVGKIVAHTVPIQERTLFWPGSIVLSPDGHYVAAVTADHHCHIWSSQDETAQAYHFVFASAFPELVFSACGDFLLCYGKALHCSSGGDYCLWALQDQCIRTKGTHGEDTSQVNELALSRGGDRFVVFHSEISFSSLVIHPEGLERRPYQLVSSLQHNPALRPGDRRRQLNSDPWLFGFKGSCKDIPSDLFVEPAPDHSSDPSYVCRRRGIGNEGDERLVVIPREYSKVWDVYGNTVAFGLAHGQITFMHFRRDMMAPEDEEVD